MYDKKRNRWRINGKNNKSLGTTKSREDAISNLEALEGGTHKSQSGNFKDHRMRGGSGRVSAASTTVYAQPTRGGNYKGRGNNLKRTAPEKIVSKDCSPTKLARKLINQDCQDAPKLQGALTSVCDYASRLKHKVGILKSQVTSLSRLLVSARKPVEVRQSSRLTTAPTQRIGVEREEIDNLEERVLMCLNKAVKERGRINQKERDQMRETLA